MCDVAVRMSASALNTSCEGCDVSNDVVRVENGGVSMQVQCLMTDGGVWMRWPLLTYVGIFDHTP